MSLWMRALDLLFPPKCPFCQAVLDEPHMPICGKCQPKLPWLEQKEAFHKVDFTAGCYSPLAYRDMVREGVHHYKFDAVQASARPLSRLMSQCVQDHREIQPDFITWVPLSRESLRKRGFDQARRLADLMGRELGLDVNPTLQKVRQTRQQSRLQEPAQRRANVLGAYELHQKSDVQGRRILLVDDVMTTGATLSSCARTLRQGGAAEIWCVTLAQAGK